MNGIYCVYIDGKKVGEYPNLITNFGKQSILRFMASNIASYASAIAVGINDALPTINDKYMGFEAFRVPIVFKTIDTTSSTIIFKGTAPVGTACAIYELGMFPSITNDLSGPYQTQALFDFDSSETWNNVVERNTLDQRLGLAAIVLQIPASVTTKTIFNDTIRLDLSGYSLTDKFRLAVHIGENITGITVKFTNSDGNDMQKTFVPSGLGYQFIDANKGEFSNINADWKNIVRTEITATGSEGSRSYIDGLQIIDADNLNPDFGLVSRTLVTAAGGVPSPILKNSNSTMDIEYRLAINL